jgi:hypothetical protein
MWRLQFPTAPSYRVALLQRKPKKKRSKVLVDVTGIEPATPCLQIQKANLDDIKKREKE